MDFKRKNIDLSMLTRELTMDPGLGIPYERWSLIRLLERLYFTHNFSSVLEGPADGMAGIKGLNSLPLAGLNCNVSVTLPSDKQIKIAEEVFKAHKVRANFIRSDDFQMVHPESSFDLVWNFCIAHILNAEEIIKEMARISRKYVMVIVPNPVNYGFFIHLLNHMMTKEPWIHGNIKYMNIRRIASLLKKNGLKVVETFLVDIPFWPDIDKPPEVLLGDFLPFLKSWLQKRASERYERSGYEIHNLPYFSKDPDFEKLMNRLSIIERRFPDFIKILFAHHNGILAVKQV